MDRLIVYPAQVPLDSDVLNTNRSVMIALGKLAGAMFGASNVAVNGLNCTPGTGMAVNVALGEMYSLQTVDATAYGTLAADTADQIVKQGIQLGTVSEATPAPGTAGQSVVYLIEGQYQDNDAIPVVLPYFNASNPDAGCRVDAALVRDDCQRRRERGSGEHPACGRPDVDFPWWRAALDGAP